MTALICVIDRLLTLLTLSMDSIRLGRWIHDKTLDSRDWIAKSKLIYAYIYPYVSGGGQLMVMNYQGLEDWDNNATKRSIVQRYKQIWCGCGRYTAPYRWGIRPVFRSINKKRSHKSHVLGVTSRWCWWCTSRIVQWLVDGGAERRLGTYHTLHESTDFPRNGWNFGCMYNHRKVWLLWGSEARYVHICQILRL